MDENKEVPKSIEELLDAIQVESLLLLLARIRSGEANATEIATAVKIAREYGLTEAWKRARSGEPEIPGLEPAVLESLPINFDESDFD